MVDRDRIQSLSEEGQNSRFFDELEQEVTPCAEDLGMSDRLTVSANLERLWLPIALNIVMSRNKLDRTLIQGILGGQGTGKSTLCSILQQVLNYLGFSVATLSIDDLYLTYAERQVLRKEDPRLIWRGPPGTHDVALGLEIIEQCLQENSSTQILLPRFDKSAFDGEGDRTEPKKIAQPNILLFEGWFVGVKPLAKFPDQFPLPIATAEDIQFAKDNNKWLQAYLPLWDKLDSLIVLYPEDYRLSQQWRKEAEQRMIATGKTGMSDTECDRFVEYFWQALHPELFIKPLLATADLVVEITSDRVSTILVKETIEKN